MQKTSAIEPSDLLKAVLNYSALCPGAIESRLRAMEYSLTIAVLIAVTFLVAGVVKGVTGMGLPTVAMGVLGAFMSPLAAAELLLIPSFVTNVWQLLSGPSFKALFARLWSMMLGIVIGTIVGARLLTSANTKWTPRLG